MTDTCSKHSFEPAAGVCKQCRNSYCTECLIFAHGPKKPPYCITCALNAAGVRRKGAAVNPRLRKKGIFGRREIVEEAPRRELGFDDIKIELPKELQDAPAMHLVTRREAPAELVAAVTAADGTVEQPLSYGFADHASDIEPEHAPDMLADWASSLDDSVGDGPTTGIEAWPGGEGETGSTF